MALNTYDDLVTGIEQWLEEDGSEFVGQIDEIINLAELRLVQDLDLAIFKRTDNTTQTVIGQPTLAKPSVAAPEVMIAIKQLWLSGVGLTTPRMLTRRSEAYVLDYNMGASNAIPTYYADLNETEILFGAPPLAVYTVNIRYLSRPEFLSDTNQSNWLSTNAWGILFKAALAEAEKFIVADERVPVWEPLVKREFYNLFGTQYDNLGAIAIPQAPRSKQ
jgi:hypothetical protein